MDYRGIFSSQDLSRFDFTRMNRSTRLDSDRRRLLSAVFEFDDELELEPEAARPFDKCGVVGVSSPESCSLYIYFALRALQHRGQESAGIVTYHDVIHYKRDMGLVHEVFDENTVKQLRGICGIGHVRYSTQGSSVLNNAQPVVTTASIGEVALGHNGEIVNAGELRKKYQQSGWAFFTDSDSEIIIRMLVNELNQTKGNVMKALRNLFKKMIGSYSIVFLIGGRVYAVRDPFGIKPLCIGQLDDGYIVTSESCAVDTIGAEFLRDVKPGEIVEFDGPEMRSTFLKKDLPEPAHCMFEYVYFARPDSVLDGRVVYDVRRNIGRILARENPVEADYIVPVPDSGLTAALGYAEESGIPYTEGLIKNRYIGRTFIMPAQAMREKSVHLKTNPIKTLVKDKRVILVDDSIVRGTTIRRIVQSVRNAGAMEVHVRIASPQIISPCYLGIDMKTRDEFIAKPVRGEEDPFGRVADIITADSLAHISIEGLVEAIGHKRENLCLGCLTEEYPVPITNEKMRPGCC